VVVLSMSAEFGDEASEVATYRRAQELIDDTLC
jgi:hypothetical protein